MKALLRKQLLRYLVPFCLAICIGFSASAQCTLGPGDLVFTGYNQLDDGVNGSTVDDAFSFMLLKDIPAGQVIYFTDLGWTSANSFQTAERGRSDAILKWTADVAYAAGTEVIITCKYNLSAKAQGGTPRGVVTIQQDSYNTLVAGVSPAEHMSLAEISGDQLFAFVNSVASPTFLAGISINRDPLAGSNWDATLAITTLGADKSMLPASLASGAQNLAIKYADPGDPAFPAAPVARYNKIAFLKTGLATQLLAALNNAANWEIRSDGNYWTPIVTSDSYTVNGVNITTHPADQNAVCQGASTTFTIVATNVCAYQWQESINGTTFNNLAEGGLYTGTKTATLTITNATTLGGRKYRVVLSGANSLTSNAGTLTLVNPILTFNSTLPANGTYNTPYSQIANITSGGSGTFTYTVNSGVLPNGLSLTAATGAITGTPTLVGSYTFEIKATDNCAAANTGTRSYTVAIAKADQTITLADQTKTYGDANFTLTANSDANLPVTYSSGTPSVATISGNTVTIVGAGTSVITATQAGNANYNAAITVTKTLTVSKKDLTLSLNAAPVITKTYDNTTTANLAVGNYNLTGKVGADDVVVTGSGSYNNPDVATGKTITVNTFVLAGTKKDNYNLTTLSATTIGNITGLALTGAFTANNKVYDGNTTATVLTRTLTGVLPADVSDVNLTGGTASFATADVAAGKTVTSTGMTLAGTKASNYTLSSVSTTTANITTKDISGTITASNKVYDGNNTATIATRGLVGVLAGDVVNVTATGGTATFANADKGTGKTVTATGITLTGTKAANYNLASIASTTADITAKDITGTFTADNKAYDGTTSANILTRNLTGVLAADVADVTLTGGTATFATATVGTGKTVTSSGMTLNGTKAGNYNLTSVATTTANITGLILTGNFTADNKVYNGNNTANILTRTLSGVLPADVADVTLNGGTATFDNANAANGKTVTSAGMTLGGLKSGNYTLSAVNTTTANITAKDITASITAGNKVYDGNNTANILTRTLTGVVTGEEADVTLTGGSATFADALVGTGKTVTGTGLTLSGTKSANYNLTSVGTTTANITGLALTGNFTADNKVYDGNTTATVLTRTLTGVLPADVADVTLNGGTASFATADVATGKTVTSTGMTLAGTKAGNYTLSSVATTTANITGLPLTGSFTAANKVYDGTNAATILTRTLTGVLPADAADVTLTGGTAIFGGINTGNGKEVSSTGMVLTGAKAGNYTLFAVNTTTANITAKDITGTFAAANKAYDGNTTASILTRSLIGVVPADVADVTLTGGTATFATATVGTGKTVTSTGMALGGTKAENYNLTSVATTTANITGLALTGNFTADNKVYDGNTTATVLTRTLTGVLPADVADVTLNGGTASFATADAATGKTVTSTGMTLGGAKAGNYTLSSVATTTANITGLPLTGSFTAANKVYDGSNAATILTRTLTGVLPADAADVTLTGGTAIFGGINTGNGKEVSSTGMVLTGAKAGNYTLFAVNTTTANITAKDITGTFAAANKAYDGNTTASILTRSLIGVVPADVADVTLTGGTATFATATVGTGKTVTSTGMILGGTKAENYNLTSVATTTANITGLALTANFTADNKVYDGNNTATILTRTLTGVLPADAADVTINGGTATFANADKGTGKTVTATGLTLGGTKAANYTLSLLNTTTADITAKDLTASFTVDNKVYDGNATAAILTRTLTGVLVADATDVSVNGGTATFNNENVGTGKAVNASGLVLAGAKATNYNISTVNATTANITAKNITGNFTADNKVYDGNTTATVLTRTLTGVLTVDVADVNLTGGTAAFANANVGTGKTVTAAGMSITGAKASNYSLTGVATTTANITGLTITGNITASNKVYDGNTTAVISGRTLTGVLTADVADVTLTGGTATFADANKGAGKTVTAAGLVLSGAKAGNYTLTSIANTTADITAKDIAGAFTADNKAYDGNTTASILTRTLTGVLTADAADVSLTGGTATFADANIGTGKTVTSTGMTLTGSKSANYNLTGVATTTANIGVRNITGVFTAGNKVYDGNTTATVLTRSLTGVLTTDVADVNLTGGTAAFADAGVGTAKVVTAAGMTITGAKAANYSLTSVATATASITAKAVSGSITANSKVYDGNTTAAISARSLTGVLAADVADVNLTGGTATFADKNVGTAKVVTGTGLVLSGAKAANYTLASLNTTTANITAKPITVTAEAKTKVYGETDPALTYTLSAAALATGDNVTGALSRATGEGVGTYAIGQNTLTAGTNYSITYVPANLQITRKVLVITAENKNRNFGVANPALTATYSGFVGTETAAVLTSPVVLSTTATVTSTAGNYPITASGAAAANYSITYVAGTLTVNPTTQTITFAALPNKLDTDGTFTLTATASSGLTVTYTSSNPAVARIINGNQVEILKAGVTNITASQAGNSDYQAATNVVQSFTVNENPPPVINISSNKGNSISKGEIATLTATGALTYQWSNANGIISGQNTATLTVRPSQNTTYTVTGFNQYGRSSTRSFNLEVRADFQVLNIMNILTPNGDGKNDTWKVENIDMYPNNTVKVFDRSGKSVFEMKGYDNSWGGTFRGTVLPEGAYYFIIDFGPGIGVRKGYITIVGQQ